MRAPARPVLSRGLARLLMRLAVFLALLLGTFALALAQGQRSTVLLDGKPLFVVGGLDKQDARTRAKRIEERLNALLDAPGRPRAVGSAPAAARPGAWAVSVSGREIVLVEPADAEDAGVPVQVLASQWAAIIERALVHGAERRRSAGSRFLTSVQASIETAFARLLESAIVLIPRVLAALLVILAFWLLASLVRWVMRMVFRRFIADLTVENLIRQIGYYTVWALGLVVAAGAFGIEPEDVATGLGLTSIALGFALKDILSNFVSGLLILSLRPFDLGDQIIIGDTEGTVERIELRATLIRTYDGRMVSVPNAETFTSRVTNNTANPVRRAAIRMYADYDIDLSRYCAVLAEALGSVEGVLREPPASVRLVQFDKDGLVLELRFWADSRRSDFLATSSEVRRAAIEHLRKAGIDLPSADLRVELANAREGAA